MKQAELIKKLRSCDGFRCRDCELKNEDVCNPILMEQAADVIEELSKALDAVNDAHNEGYDVGYWSGRRDYEPKWIPVTERLPEERINPNTRDFEYVLCVTIWGDVRPFKYGTPIGQKDAHFWNGAGYVDAYVTHWMLLPEPPKEETDG